MKNKSTLFIKPSRTKDTHLNIERIRLNHKKNIETVIVPDVNVIIAMENAGKENASLSTLAKWGIFNLFDLLNKSSTENLDCAFWMFPALSEMPGKSAYSSIKKLRFFAEKFQGDKHFYTFDDVKEFDKEQETNNFLEMSVDRQMNLSVSFSSLMLILLINRDLNHLQERQKLISYYHLAEKYIGLLSGKEAMIAIHGLSNFQTNDKNYNNFRTNIRKNYIKDKKNKYTGTMSKDNSISSMINLASNGASDLAFLNFCNSGDAIKFNNKKQDLWVATFDAKLEKFTKNIHNAGPENETGMYIVSDDFSHLDSYLKDAMWDFSRRMVARYNTVQAPTSEALHNSAFNIINLAREGISEKDVPKNPVTPMTSPLYSN